MSKVTFNPKRDTPYLAAITQAAQFSLAGAILLGPKGWFFGGLLGLLVSMALAYASSQYADVAQKRKTWVMVGMIILGALSPIAIGTSMYLELPEIITPIWRGVVGAAWAILPDASVALVGFVAGKGMTNAGNEPAIVKEKPEKPPVVVALPAVSPLPVAQSVACQYGCGFERATQQAINAHYRGCKLNPANMPMRVDSGV